MIGAQAGLIAALLTGDNHVYVIAFDVLFHIPHFENVSRVSIGLSSRMFHVSRKR
jgi:hypothetical protein